MQCTTRRWIAVAAMIITLLAAPARGGGPRVMTVDPDEDRPKGQVFGSHPNKPKEMTPSLLCNACRAIVIETEKKLDVINPTGRSESDVYDVLDGICDQKNFRIYDHIPPTMVKACHNVMDRYREEGNDDGGFEAVFLERGVDMAKRQKRLCSRHAKKLCAGQQNDTIKQFEKTEAQKDEPTKSEATRKKEERKRKRKELNEAKSTVKRLLAKKKTEEGLTKEEKKELKEAKKVKKKGMGKKKKTKKKKKKKTKKKKVKAEDAGKDEL